MAAIADLLRHNVIRARRVNPAKKTFGDHPLLLIRFSFSDMAPSLVNYIGLKKSRLCSYTTAVKFFKVLCVAIEALQNWPVFLLYEPQFSTFSTSALLSSAE